MKVLIRLLIVLLVSCLIYTMGSLWYSSGISKFNNTNPRKLLAYIDHSKEEVRRRPAQRQVWQVVRRGDPVYSGEALRTPVDGEARIHFIDSNGYMEIEGNSTIVLTESLDKELTLDLLEGSAQVHPENIAAPIVLKQGPRKIAIGRNPVFLQKTDGDDRVVPVSISKKTMPTSSSIKKADRLVSVALPSVPNPLIANENINKIDLSKFSKEPMVPVAEKILEPNALSAPTVKELGNLKTDEDGILTVHWKPVVNAKQYQVRVLGAQGETVKTQMVINPAIVFNDLEAGDYEFQVSALDSKGRIGELTKRKLQVPKEQESEAPKLKSIKVK